MKKFILFLFFYINITVVNAQWEPRNNGITNKEAIRCFANEGTNIYTGSDGGVFMTTDYGDNWNAKNKGLTTIIMPDTVISSLAINENNIFAGTDIQGIFRSTDKGENWVQKSNGLFYDSVHLAIIHTLKIIDNDIFTGTDKGIFVSSDNGENWFPKNNGLPQEYDSLLNETFIGIYSLADSGNNVYAGTVYGVYLTTNNGDNWIAKNKDIENLIILSLATSGNNIYAGTEFGGIFLSTDNGDNWENIGFKNYIIPAIIVRGNNIIVGGYGVNLSTDNGNSWTAINSGLTHLGVMSLIINGDYIFAGINSYGIYRAKLSDLGITDVKEPDQNNESIIEPNPASSEVKLKFESTNFSKIQISIFDLLGKEVFSSSEDSNIGMNEKVIDCRSLGTGYYIVRLKQNDKVEAKPLLILK